MPGWAYKTVHATKMWETLLPAAVSSVCTPGEAPVGVSQALVPQRVIKEGGMVQGLWSASGTRAWKRCI